MTGLSSPHGFYDTGAGVCPQYVPISLIKEKGTSSEIPNHTFSYIQEDQSAAVKPLLDEIQDIAEEILTITKEFQTEPSSYSSLERKNSVTNSCNNLFKIFSNVISQVEEGFSQSEEIEAELVPIKSALDALQNQSALLSLLEEGTEQKINLAVIELDHIKQWLSIQTMHREKIESLTQELEVLSLQTFSIEEGKMTYSFDSYIKILEKVPGILAFYYTLPTSTPPLVKLKTLRLIKEDLSLIINARKDFIHALNSNLSIDIEEAKCRCDEAYRKLTNVDVSPQEKLLHFQKFEEESFFFQHLMKYQEEAEFRLNELEVNLSKAFVQETSEETTQNPLTWAISGVASLFLNTVKSVVNPITTLSELASPERATVMDERRITEDCQQLLQNLQEDKSYLHHQNVNNTNLKQENSEELLKVRLQLNEEIRENNVLSELLKQRLKSILSLDPEKMTENKFILYKKALYPFFTLSSIPLDNLPLDESKHLASMWLNRREKQPKPYDFYATHTDELATLINKNHPLLTHESQKRDEIVQEMLEELAKPITKEEEQHRARLNTIFLVMQIMPGIQNMYSLLKKGQEVSTPPPIDVLKQKIPHEEVSHIENQAGKLIAFLRDGTPQRLKANIEAIYKRFPEENWPIVTTALREVSELKGNEKFTEKQIRSVRDSFFEQSLMKKGYDLKIIEPPLDPTKFLNFQEWWELFTEKETDVGLEKPSYKATPLLLPSKTEVASEEITESPSTISSTADKVTSFFYSLGETLSEIGSTIDSALTIPIPGAEGAVIAQEDPQRSIAAWKSFLESSPIAVSDALFQHVLGSYFGLATGLDEEVSSYNMLETLHLLISAKIDTLKTNPRTGLSGFVKSLTQVDAPLESFQKISDKFLIAKKLTQSFIKFSSSEYNSAYTASSHNEFKAEIQGELQKLQPGESFFFQGGWKKENAMGEYKVVYEIVKEPGATFTFRVYNRSAGRQHHQFAYVGGQPEFMAFTEVTGVKKNSILETDFLDKLLVINAPIELYSYFEKNISRKNRDTLLYDDIIPILSGQPSYSLSDATHFLRGLSVTHSSYLSLTALLSQKLEDRDSYNRWELELESKILIDYFKANKNSFNQDELKRRLMLEGLRQFSRDVISAAKEKIITNDEIIWIQKLIEPMQQALTESENIYLQNVEKTISNPSKIFFRSDDLLIDVKTKGISPEDEELFVHFPSVGTLIENQAQPRLKFEEFTDTNITPSPYIAVDRSTWDYSPNFFIEDFKLFMMDVQHGRQLKNYINTKEGIKSFIKNIPLEGNKAIWNHITADSAKQLVTDLSTLSHEFLWSILKSEEDIESRQDRFSLEELLTSTKILTLADGLMRHFKTEFGIEFPHLLQKQVAEFIDGHRVTAEVNNPEWTEVKRELSQYWKKVDPPSQRTAISFFGFEQIFPAEIQTRQGISLPTIPSGMRMQAINSEERSKFPQTSGVGIHTFWPDIEFAKKEAQKLVSQEKPSPKEITEEDKQRAAETEQLNTYLQFLNPATEKAIELLLNPTSLPTQFVALRDMAYVTNALLRKPKKNEGAPPLKDEDFDEKITLNKKFIKSNISQRPLIYLYYRPFGIKHEDYTFTGVKQLDYVYINDHIPIVGALSQFTARVPFEMKQEASSALTRLIMHHKKIPYVEVDEHSGSYGEHQYARLRLTASERNSNLFEETQRPFYLVKEEFSLSDSDITALLALSSNKEMQIQETFSYFKKNIHLLSQPSYQKFFLFLMQEDGLLIDEFRRNPTHAAHFSRELSSFCDEQIYLNTYLNKPELRLFFIELNLLFSTYLSLTEKKHPGTLPKGYSSPFPTSRFFLYWWIHKGPDSPKEELLTVAYYLLAKTYEQEKKFNEEVITDLINFSIQLQLHPLPTSHPLWDFSKEIDAKDLIRKFRAPIEKALSKDPGAILDNVIYKLTKNDAKNTWASNSQFPLFYTQDGKITLNVLTGQVVFKGVEQIPLSKSLRNDPRIRSLSHEDSPLLASPINLNQFTFTDTQGRKCRLITKDGEQVHTIQIQFQGHWHQEYSYKNLRYPLNQILKNEYLWYSPKTNEMVATDKNTGKSKYIIEYPDTNGAIVHRLNDSGKKSGQILADIYTISSTSKNKPELYGFLKRLESPEHTYVWYKKKPYEPQEIVLPRFGLNFHIHPDEEGRLRAYSQQFPGYRIAVKQWVPQLGDVTTYLVLENVKGGHQPLIIMANQPMKKLEDTSLITKTELENDTEEKKQLLLYDIDSKSKIRPRKEKEGSEEARYHLARVYLWKHDYPKALEYLKGFGSRLKPLEKKEAEIVNSILNLMNSNRDFTPEAKAIRLYASLLKERSMPPGKEDMGTTAKLYSDYLKDKDQSRLKTLSPDEEIFILKSMSNLTPLEMTRLQELDPTLFKTRFADGMPKEKIYATTSEDQSFPVIKSLKKPTSESTVSEEFQKPSFTMKHHIMTKPILSDWDNYVTRVPDTDEKKGALKKNAKELQSLFSQDPGEKVAQRKFKDLSQGLQTYIDNALNITSEQYHLKDLPQWNRLKFDLDLKVTHETNEIRSLTNIILSLANKPFADPVDEAQRSLKQLGGLEKPLEIKELIQLFRLGDPNAFLKRNPALTSIQISFLISNIQELLLVTIYQRHLTQLFDKTEKIIKMSNTIKEKEQEGKNTSRDSQELNELINSFVYLAKAKRNYNVDEHPDYLILEYEMGILMRTDQVLNQQRIGLSKQKVESAQLSGTVLEAIPGSGKTSVLGPLRVLNDANGKRLALYVMPESLLTSMALELQEKLETAYSQKVEILHYDREIPLTLTTLTSINQRLEDIVLGKKLLLMTDSSVQSLVLKLVETLLKGIDSAETSSIISILEMLRNSGVVTIDEIDAILDVLKAHHFTFGDPSYIPIEEEIVSTDIYKYILTEIHPLKKLNFNFLPKHEGDPFDAVKYKREIQLLLIDAVLAGKIGAEDEEFANYIKKLTQKEKDNLRIYLNNEYTADSFRMINEIPSMKIKNFLAVCKQEISRLIPHTANKNLFEQYGPLPKDATTRKENPVKRDDIDLAIPFHSSGDPMETSQFGTNLEIINFTLQMIMEMGISAELAKKNIRLIEDQLQEEILSKEFASISECPSFERFTEICGDSQIKPFHVTNQDLLNIANRINKNPALLMNFIRKFILPELKSYSQQLHSSGQIYSALFNWARGMSGTLWNEETFPDMFFEYFPSDAAPKTLMLLWENSPRIAQSVEWPTTTSLDLKGQVQEVVRLLYNREQGFKGSFSDCAGIFRKVADNEIVARAIANVLPSNYQGVVFYNQDGTIAVYNKAQDKIDPIEQCGIAKENLAVYWDQKHTRGSDIKLGAQEVGTVSIGRHTMLKDLIQAVWRLRGLETGQKVDFIVLEEDREVIRNTIKQITGDMPSKTLELSHLLLYAMYNQAMRQGDDNHRSLKQKLEGFLIGKVIETMIDSKTTPLEIFSLISMTKDLFVLNVAQNPYELYGKPESLKSSKVVVQQELEQFFERPAMKAFENHSALKRRYNIETIKSGLTEITNKELSKLPENLSASNIYGTAVTLKSETKTETKVETQVQFVRSSRVYKPRIPDVWKSEMLFDSRFFVPVDTHKDAAEDKMPSLLTVKTALTLSAINNPYSMGTKRNVLEKFITVFDPKILVTSNFMPKNTDFTQATIQPFGEYQDIVSHVIITQNTLYPYEYSLVLASQEDISQIEKLLKEDTLKPSSKQRNQRICIYNLMTGIVQQGKPSESFDPTTMPKDPTIVKLVTQAKFYGGYLTYSKEEKKVLAKWLLEKDPTYMRELFYEHILKHKSSEKALFENSPLDRIFKEAIKRKNSHLKEGALEESRNYIDDSLAYIKNLFNA